MPKTTTYTDNNKGVEVILKPGESIYAEPSAFCYSDGFIEAKTTTGGIMSAVKKLVTKEKLFQVLWTNNGSKPGRIGFASPYLSTIEEVEISPSYSLIAQRGAWLVSDPTVKLDLTMNLGMSGFFGGEGLIFQKFTGSGRVFITAGGDLKAINLARDESLNIDTGCIVGFAESVKYEVKLAGGILTMCRKKNRIKLKIAKDRFFSLAGLYKHQYRDCCHTATAPYAAFLYYLILGSRNTSLPTRA